MAAQGSKEVREWRWKVRAAGQRVCVLSPNPRMSDVAHTAEVQPTYADIKLTSKPVLLLLNLYPSS